MKLCKDCKYAKHEDDKWWCNKEKDTKLSLVDGTSIGIVYACKSMRCEVKFAALSFAMSGIKVCGEEGRFFEPKEEGD